MNYQQNIYRDERVLILPHNTLRAVDAMLDYKYRSLEEGATIESFEAILKKNLLRKKRDLSKIIKIPDYIMDHYKENWNVYWDIAPRTKMYEYLDVVKNQKFLNTIKVLFEDKRASEPAYENLYYDGSIDALEEIIVKENITCLILDDCQLLKEISERGKINLNQKSFILPKIGYNYEYNAEYNALMPKYILYQIQKDWYCEVAMISLFDIDGI